MAQNRAGKGAAAAPPPPAATTAAPTSTAGRIDKLPLHVLLIGNSSYARNAALRNPERDVQLLEKAFTARGARVRKLLDLSVNQLENVIPSFLASLGPPPFTVWLAYSGHAVQINGRNYLQGIDSDFSNAAKVRGFGLDLDRVQGLLERARPVAAVLSVDACRNNPFEPEMTRGAVEGLAALEPRGMCVSFSTAPYMRALDGESGQNSPYARALADALAGKQRSRSTPSCEKPPTPYTAVPPSVRFRNTDRHCAANGGSRPTRWRCARSMRHPPPRARKPKAKRAI